MATNRKTKTNQIWEAAHPLRDAKEDGRDYLRRLTPGRVTYGAACRRWGKAEVHRAMSSGWVYLEGVPNRSGAAFDPTNATAETRLCGNGITLG